MWYDTAIHCNFQRCSSVSASHVGCYLGLGSNLPLLAQPPPSIPCPQSTPPSAPLPWPWNSRQERPPLARSPRWVHRVRRCSFSAQLGCFRWRRFFSAISHTTSTFSHWSRTRCFDSNNWSRQHCTGLHFPARGPYTVLELCSLTEVPLPPPSLFSLQPRSASIVRDALPTLDENLQSQE